MVSVALHCPSVRIGKTCREMIQKTIEALDKQSDLLFGAEGGIKCPIIIVSLDLLEELLNWLRKREKKR